VFRFSKLPVIFNASGEATLSAVSSGGFRHESRQLFEKDSHLAERARAPMRHLRKRGVRYVNAETSGIRTGIGTLKADVVKTEPRSRCGLPLRLKITQLRSSVEARNKDHSFV
jgi:hypothetical protein